MEPIIRNPAVASETRQIGRPRATQAEVRTPQPEAPAAQTKMPAPVEEKKSAQEQSKAAILVAQALNGEEGTRRRLADEKALAEIQSMAEKRGYAAGLERGEEEARKILAEKMSRLSSIIAALGQAKTDAIESGEDEIVEIVYTAVCRVVGEAAVSPAAISDTVKRIAAQIKDRDPLTVRLHPEDFELMQAMSSQAGIPIAEKPVSLYPDAAIELGGCVVEGPTGSLDARLEMQLECLREALLEARKSRRQDEEAL